jgi:hypothetical protein
MFEFALIVVGFICGYAFRGAIGHEVSKLGTELKAEIAKLKL